VGAGQRTSIHNHTVWGLVGVMRGAEQCAEYSVPHDLADVELRCNQEHRLERLQIDRVSPVIGDWHAVSNALVDEVSISIHVYGADIGRVERSVFDPLARRVKPFVSGYSNERAWIAPRTAP
jgi:3-mercaptopropionate dioxygenase